jgi:hypothetical protein
MKNRTAGLSQDRLNDEIGDTLANLLAVTS